MYKYEKIKKKKEKKASKSGVLAHGAAGSIVASRCDLVVALQFISLPVVSITVREVMKEVGVQWCWRHVRQTGVGCRAVLRAAGRGHPGLLGSSIGIRSVVSMGGGRGHVIFARSRSQAIGSTIG